MSMRFSVPQFIDVEDKIIGPISIRQFITILVGGGLMFLAFKLLSFIVFILVGFLLFALTGVVAFAKINGRPFHMFLVVIIQTLRRPNIKIWDRTYEEGGFEKEDDKDDAADALNSKPQLDTSRLQQLGLMVDTGGAYQPDLERENSDNL